MPKTPFTLRDLSPARDDEITLVAERMRDTLIEVEGDARGAGLYSLDWLVERVRWHLDAAFSDARVVLAEARGGEIVGHGIFRVEGDGLLRQGLVATTYVMPSARRQGVAQRLLHEAEAWFTARGLPRCSTWTSSTNTPLIALYARSGYREAERGSNDLVDTMMVRLEKRLTLATSR